MDEIGNRTIELATELLTASLKLQTRSERSDAARMARMMGDERGKAFTLAMVDQVFRSHDPRMQARRLRNLLRRFGVPSYLSVSERFLLQTGAIASHLFPIPVMASVEAKLRADSARVILPGEPEALAKYLDERKRAGTRVNLNHLGEAILGEEEAARRVQAVLGHLANPAVNYVSVKISSIFSQINLIDWDGTVEVLKDRLRTIYRAAMFTGKFVNLDMEEYRDLELTLAAFKQVLDESEFYSLSAGVTLQAYLPDSWNAQLQLTTWAQARVDSGGATIKLRLVKGANLAMENVEAEMHGWNSAPYSSKAQTDANYRRMLEFGCEPESARAVRLGVASHNLFDVALALVLREQFGVREFVELEMLEGMANHQARAVQARAGGLLVYAPVVRRADFFSAIAYLVRRLDENSAPENFLRELFSLSVGSDAWTGQVRRFEAGWRERDSVCSHSNRAKLPSLLAVDGKFHNAPDTDWTQSRNRSALMSSIASFRGNTEEATQASRLQGDLDALLSTAVAAQKSWEVEGWAERAAILSQCAVVMERQRFDTIAELMHAGKKAAFDGDVEVSEAIDFARYYAASVISPHVRATALGVVVIAPPWNFPYAIPCGGVLAALMAGNAVILKPAPEAAAVGRRLANRLWEAGVPENVLQFFPCADGEVGKSLICDARVNAVVLTGAYETARRFLEWRPSLRLFAETSGKNALVITAQADRDLAVKDLVRSAFGHSGQKCSAASVAILEAEAYDDPAFRRMLRDAAASLRVGPATGLGNVVTPLIQPPGANLLRALTTLDPGEEWLLEPRVADDDPCLWSPGIKLGVARGSWFHRTECFGPVLGLMRARDLPDAVEIQNDSELGLTGGIHSLDRSEIEYWKERVRVGNAYINRAITGAIVRRQPFGGWKHSSFGPGAKAGGPNYVAQFVRLEDSDEIDAAESYSRAWREIFSKDHDPSGLRCESNVFRYRPCRGVILRLEENDPRVLERARLAVKITGVPLHVSLASQESEAELAARLGTLSKEAEFLRTVRAPGDALLRAAYDAGLNWIDGPVLADGGHELSRWLREQSVSETRHRYGLVVSGRTGGEAEDKNP